VRPGRIGRERLPRELQVAVPRLTMTGPELQRSLRRPAQDSGETRDLQMSQRPAPVQSALPLRISGTWPEELVPAAAATPMPGSARWPEVLAWVSSPSKPARTSPRAPAALTTGPQVRSAPRRAPQTEVRLLHSASPREVSEDLWMAERLPRMAQRHSASAAQRLASPPAAARTGRRAATASGGRPRLPRAAAVCRPTRVAARVRRPSPGAAMSSQLATAAAAGQRSRPRRS
jgi:hypothetical protein